MSKGDHSELIILDPVEIFYRPHEDSYEKCLKAIANYCLNIKTKIKDEDIYDAVYPSKLNVFSTSNLSSYDTYVVLVRSIGFESKYKLPIYSESDCTAQSWREIAKAIYTKQKEKTRSAFTRVSYNKQKDTTVEKEFTSSNPYVLYDYVLQSYIAKKIDKPEDLEGKYRITTQHLAFVFKRMFNKLFSYNSEKPKVYNNFSFKYWKSCSKQFSKCKDGLVLDKDRLYKILNILMKYEFIVQNKISSRRQSRQYGLGIMSPHSQTVQIDLTNLTNQIH